LCIYISHIFTTGTRSLREREKERQKAAQNEKKEKEKEKKCQTKEKQCRRESLINRSFSVLL